MQAKTTFITLVTGLLLGFVGANSAGASDAVCGDGNVDPGEACDDGNATDGDGCSVACEVEACDDHFDCPQGSFCHRGVCRMGDLPTYHCGQPGCPPGHWCVEADGVRSTCDEDPDYECTTVCDCGPAHACMEIAGVGYRCVADTDDLWIGPATNLWDIEVPEDELTYCCGTPQCLPALLAYQDAGTSLECGDPDGGTQLSCGAHPCAWDGDCSSGQSCVDFEFRPDTDRVSCSLEGGYCVSFAVAEATFGWGHDDLLEPCDDSGPGERCAVGWRPGGTHAIEQVDGVAGSCGDGTCDAWESALSCTADCSCGDGVCDTTEYGACLVDCGICGDGTCGGLETPKLCPADCEPVAGDGSCDAGEAPDGVDCGCDDSASYLDTPSMCGDGLCQPGGLIPETCDNCAQDCDDGIDSDGDGLNDGCDPCPLDVANDVDGDALCEDVDNCPAVANPGQADYDGDGAGDACDPDDDDDGVGDGADNCPFFANADQTDSDGDGVGDVCDDDADGDGVVDGFDACLGTDGGAVVDDEGCSVLQRCACGLMGNHGQYVRCVAAAANDFVDAGRIDETDKAEYISVAAQSGC